MTKIRGSFCIFLYNTTRKWFERLTLWPMVTCDCEDPSVVSNDLGFYGEESSESDPEA